MKKMLFLAALVLMSTSCFAQKSNVKLSKKLSSQETPDYDGARAAIREALNNDETKNLASTWLEAGMIGYREKENAYYQQLMGVQPDMVKIGAAVLESFNYWQKADEIAMTPVLDKKGREVVDQKTRNDIAKKIVEYYQTNVLSNYAVEFYNKHDYKSAYEVMKTHLSIPDLAMMQNEKMQALLPKDTLYNQFCYYAAQFAINAEMHKEAIDMLDKIKVGTAEANQANKFIFQEYMALKDSANAIATLQTAVDQFPQDPWFLQNLINIYIFSGKKEEASNYLDKAIEREPNVAQYHLVKGKFYAADEMLEQAKASYEKAIELDSKLAEAYAGIGRLYYFEADKLEKAAYNIMDNRQYEKARKEFNAVYKNALPYFEKALEAEPTEREYMVTLRGLYYRFQMMDKYKEMKERLEQ